MSAGVFHSSSQACPDVGAVKVKKIFDNVLLLFWTFEIF